MHSSTHMLIFRVFLLACALSALTAPTFAQGVDSASDGSDGALELTTPGTIDFFSLPGLDSDDDGIYHFTTITVGAGVVLVMRSAVEGPVTWLASGSVVIEGTIDLDGEDGHLPLQVRRRSTPGAGGYSGGAGSGIGALPENGAGPGGGMAPEGISFYATGAGHANPGDSGDGGAAYGNPALLPLVGGSGGGGGYAPDTSDPEEPGLGGGAGGGALLIASSTSITVDGAVTADGGCTGHPSARGGSGGAIRLLAPTLAGTGSLSAKGDLGCFDSFFTSSIGRIRLEALVNQFSGSTLPAASISFPGIVAIAVEDLPLRVVTVDGVAVPANPRGTFVPPDVVLSSAGPVQVAIEGRGIPLGTAVDVSMFLEDGSVTSVASTPLAGTLALSTATATVTIPSGFVSFFVSASWTP